MTETIIQTRTTFLITLITDDDNKSTFLSNHISLHVHVYRIKL